MNQRRNTEFFLKIKIESEKQNKNKTFQRPLGQ